MRIVITGATGLLGRNLLFEIIKNNLDKLDKLEIFILGRSKDNLDIRKRFDRIIAEDGLIYLDAKGRQEEDVKQFCREKVKCINIDLIDKQLDLETKDVKKLKESKIDYFFHIAALTDFRNTPRVVQDLQETNVEGTKRILSLLSALDVKEFSYVGSAYSCGKSDGLIQPDYINFIQEFRNPYEKTKLEAESLVREFSRNSGLKCRYFRPSTICGRLLEKPKGATNKFDVFYSWLAFFLRLKLKKLKTYHGLYDEPFDLDIRICYNKKSGLNIVPADYAAKVMYQACIKDELQRSYHLVNNEETPHKLYLQMMLELGNLKGVKIESKIPDNMNEMERLYYKSTGHIFTPYINSDSINFANYNHSKAFKSTNLECPKVDRDNFKMLLNYAKRYNFGIKLLK